MDFSNAGQKCDEIWPFNDKTAIRTWASFIMEIAFKVRDEGFGSSGIYTVPIRVIVDRVC